MLGLTDIQQRILDRLAAEDGAIVFKLGIYYFQGKNERKKEKIPISAFRKLDDFKLLIRKESAGVLTTYKLSEFGLRVTGVNPTPSNDLPYLHRTVRASILAYNPTFGDKRVCRCGEEYTNHFYGDGTINTKKCNWFVEHS